MLSVVVEKYRSTGNFAPQLQHSEPAALPHVTPKSEINLTGHLESLSLDEKKCSRNEIPFFGWQIVSLLKMFLVGILVTHQEILWK